MPYKDKELGKLKKKEYYKKNKDKLIAYYDREEVIARKKLADNVRRFNRKTEAVAFLGNKCNDCGKEYPLPCYDFHHVDPTQKEFDPCSGLTKKRDVFFTELAKCILLCANCHRMRHYKYDSEFK